MTFFLTPDIASKNTLLMPRNDRLQSSPPRVSLRKMDAELLRWQLLIVTATNRDPRALFPPLLQKPASALQNFASRQALFQHRRGN